MKNCASALPIAANGRRPTKISEIFRAFTAYSSEE
jgi:hypothetical protein